MPPSQQVRLEFAQRDISFQYAQLCLPSNCPKGVYVQLDDDDTHLWHGVIFVQNGPFSGGIFRFDIVFPPAYPSATPQVFFPPTLLHPLVDPDTGRLLLSSRFPTAWRPRQDFVFHILQFVKNAFQEDNLESLREGQVANPEVYRMFRTHRTLFNKLALQSVSLSTAPSSLYDVSGGSGFPNPSIGLNRANPARPADGMSSFTSRPMRTDEANGILFRKLDDGELAELRGDIFGDEAADSPAPAPVLEL
ncbi:UBC-like protein [Moesziomyces antarcticus]|uniref:UBC-like protein n=1 Tax=Pseudozyma antarctica TaxID=84753 RepID=UPI0007195FC6|nr:UBC-like protein [Moesziomyces antarcticus]GAK62212.1 UBC-like protein [Moesziomyces antarcticus]